MMSSTQRYRILVLMFSLFAFVQMSQAQRFALFAPEIKTDCPSVVYDFLERYLFEIDSLQRKGVNVDQRLRDDKVVFVTGSAASARKITADMAFAVNKTDSKYYEVSWTDSLGNIVLDLAFPMQYELLLGKPKVDIEKEFESALTDSCVYAPLMFNADSLTSVEDSCLSSIPAHHYYVESLNNATYYRMVQDSVGMRYVPVFCDSDKWHSAANLFQGYIDSIAGYTLYVEQNLYGFKKVQYSVTLQQWLAYCQSMKLNVYFAVEEERKDGLKALLVAQSQDLGFNHMMSLIIPDNFVTNRKSVFKATLNAYIPTQNVKDLYQKYVDKPKKRI